MRAGGILVSNGRQNHKFGRKWSSKLQVQLVQNRSGILLYCAGTDGITCGRKSRGDEKQLIDLEWPNISQYTQVPDNIIYYIVITIVERNTRKCHEFVAKYCYECMA